MNRWILPLLPNRVRRSYTGGALLEFWEGKNRGRDGNQPEDWIASTVTAVNPGLPPVPGEGLATVQDNGLVRRLVNVFEEDPAHFLGEHHVSRLGTGLGFLLKLLDSSIRLHVQVHPTRQFARKHLHSPWGKLETYYILASRPGISPYIRLGFQHAPSSEEWKRIVLEQDTPAMDACFEPVPVKPGEVWVVPGGLPHAIGEGLLVVEIMEPSDLVVRCEFERGGIVLPPPARFMGRDPDFALQILDFTSLSVEQVTARYRVAPRTVLHQESHSLRQLIGKESTDCFESFLLSIRRPAVIPKENRVLVGLVLDGQGCVSAGGEELPVARGTRFVIAAAAEELSWKPGDSEIRALLCRPGSLVP